MKTILLTFAATLALLNSFAQSESHPAINAGLTLNFIDNSSGNISDQMGFYVGAEVAGKLTDRVGYFGGLQFIQQRAEVDNINMEVYSLNPAFAFKLYPSAKAWYLYGGMQMSLATGVRVDNESVSEFEKGDISFITGLGFELSDRFDIVTRYSQSLERNYFNSTVQIGASYKFVER